MVAAKERLTIVGCGIVGLMVAYAARQRWPSRPINIFDAGPDPRRAFRNQTEHGATWSGLDARHVSITETGPWTAPHRAELLRRSSDEGGWNCLSGVQLSAAEESWYHEFRAITRNEQTHLDNSASVTAINAQGLARWSELSTVDPDLFNPISSWWRLPIVCATEDDLFGEHQAEHLLDPDHVTEPTRSVPDHLEELRPKLADGTLVGSFLVRGNAYRVRTLCTRLIDWLEDTNSVFRWSHRLDLADLEEVAEGDVIWAAGVSSGSVSLLAHHGVLLQGVLGCWITLPNTSISQPFKLLAREPVNFINATPVGKTLLVSGGYGWVGERPYAEAASLSRPLARSFEKEVQRLIRADVEGSLGYDSALCIRPSLPSGVPLIGQLRFPGRRRPVLACVGHAAGGFTEAPAVADQVVELLDETPS